MNAHSPTASTTTATPPGVTVALSGFEAAQFAVLERLTQVGMAIIDAIEKQVLEGPPPAEAAPAAEDAGKGDLAPSPAPPRISQFHNDLALAFSRASRAVRLGLAMQGKLLADAKAAHDVAVSAAEVQSKADHRQAYFGRPARRDRIEKIVERIVRDHHDEAWLIKRKMGEAHERLTDSDQFGDLLNLPFSEAIDRICRDLDLSPDWASLAQEGWAQNERKSRKVGRPLAALDDPPPEIDRAFSPSGPQPVAASP